MTAVILPAEDLLSASTMIINSKRLSPAGAQVGCMRKTSLPRTFSSMLILISPSLKVVTFAWPSLTPSCFAISFDKSGLPLPEKRTKPDREELIIFFL